MKHTRAWVALTLAAALSLVGLGSAQGIDVSVGEGVGVSVSVGESVGVSVGESIGVGVGDGVGVGVGVGVGNGMGAGAGAETVDRASSDRRLIAKVTPETDGAFSDERPTSGVAPGADGARPVLGPPVAPLRASRLFDPPPEPWHAGHRGIDLFTSPGADIRSPGAGTVVFVGKVVNRGVLSIDLDVGLRASLEPASSTLAQGARVSQGQVVGKVESTAAASHCAPSHCLHWGLRDGDEYLDPLDWLVGFGPIRLLPLRGK
ncbi:M23 family metallopeptidase [Demequina aurantiaca]|uniref:M23 family metallopeptidase n=1 Tax=Demequina aurantiaca TaxID=676200 RepID=UPI003D32C652